MSCCVGTVEEADHLKQWSQLMFAQASEEFKSTLAEQHLAYADQRWAMLTVSAICKYRQGAGVLASAHSGTSTRAATS